VGLKTEWAYGRGGSLWETEQLIFNIGPEWSEVLVMHGWPPTEGGILALALKGFHTIILSLYHCIVVYISPSAG
jgi:hypothetical protein